MSQSQVDLIIERWVSDEAFKARMQKAPLETAEAEGYVLSDEERSALQRMDLNQTDEELAQNAHFAAG